MAITERVLLAGDFPERPPLVVGGIQAVTWQLANAVAKVGDFEVHAASCERYWQTAPPARRWRRRLEGCTAHYQRSPRRLPHVVCAWTTDAEYVRAQIRAVRPRLVHAHGQSGYAIGAIRSGVPHVVTPHGMLAHEKRAPVGAAALSGERLREALWRRTEDWCLARARHVIVISPYVRELIAPRTRGRLHEIPNPVDPDFFELERVEQAEPVLLTVGWLNARKRHELIIAALGLVRERVPGVRLRIVGNVEGGDERQLTRLRRLTAELGLSEAVQFLHRVSQQELLEEYRRASVYVHAAAEESSPVAVAQAMAAGLGLCAVEIPGLRHMLQPDLTGVFAREPTPAGLARALVDVLSERSVARSLGARARSDARASFHPASVGARTTELYHEVIAEAAC
ncbi:MAG TPA: glycosyltransferase family 4 protein [Solirubrobacteraceae bacterium]|nr:glycosyltransferase family 4 protein [Solirubrobacteraceae bacterium]